MQCPRCTAHIPVEPVNLTDAPGGLVAVVNSRFDPYEYECPCGWIVPVLSSIGRRNRKGVA